VWGGGAKGVWQGHNGTNLNAYVKVGHQGAGRTRNGGGGKGGVCVGQGGARAIRTRMQRGGVPGNPTTRGKCVSSAQHPSNVGTTTTIVTNLGKGNGYSYEEPRHKGQ